MYGDGGDGACNTSSTCCGGLLYVETVAGSCAVGVVAEVPTAGTAAVVGLAPPGAAGGGEFGAGVVCEHAAIATARRNSREIVRGIARH